MKPVIRTIRILGLAICAIISVVGCGGKEAGISLNPSETEISAGTAVNIDYVSYAPYTTLSNGMGPLPFFTLGIEVDSTTENTYGNKIEAFTSANGRLTFQPYRTTEYAVTAHFCSVVFFCAQLPAGMGASGSIDHESATASVTITVDIDVPIATLFPLADSNFQSCIEDTGALMTSDLTTLDCSNRGITDLTGIAYFYNLKNVNLENNAIEFPAAFSTSETHVEFDHLEELTSISFAGNPSECVLLQDFHARHYDTISVTLPDHCPSLERIADYVLGPDADPNLQQCFSTSTLDTNSTFVHQIRSISCSNYSLADLSNMKHFPNLESLRLVGIEGQACVDYNELSSLNKLTYFSTNICALDYAALSQLTELTSLRFNKFAAPTIEFLASHNNLKVLNLQFDQPVDLSSLSTVINLTELNLSDSAVTQIPDLSSLDKLEKLTINNNTVADWDSSGIHGLDNLERIEIENSQLSVVSGLSNLPKLRDLLLENNTIHTLNIGAELPALEIFDLDDNQLSSIDGLSGLSLPLLKFLSLKNNTIQDITPLSSMDLDMITRQDTTFINGFPKVDLTNNDVQLGINLIPALDFNTIVLSDNANLPWCELEALDSPNTRVLISVIQPCIP